MKITITKERELAGGKKCYTCYCNLKEYLESLKKDFYDYQVQRRVVKNIYLDRIYDTIKQNEPVPVFTLLSKTGIEEKDGVSCIDMDNCEILDGLQRTFRLWSILEFKQIIVDNDIKDYSGLRSWLKTNEELGAFFRSIDFINTAFLQSLFIGTGIDGIIDSYEPYEIELSLWTGLDDNEAIRLMLQLNAGQRPVTSTHQYELVFMHYFDRITSELGDIQLIRERDADYYSVKNKARSVGQYLLASVIVALQSFVQKKTVRIAPANKIIFDPSELLEKNKVDKYFQEEYLLYFINYIKACDDAFSQLDEEYVHWFGKDTTLSGIFAALGYMSKGLNDEKEILDDFLGKLRGKTIDFRIQEFKKEYDKLSSAKVNVGNALRRSIFEYTMVVLHDCLSKYSWSQAFDLKKSIVENEDW